MTNKTNRNYLCICFQGTNEDYFKKQTKTSRNQNLKNKTHETIKH